MSANDDRIKELLTSIGVDDEDCQDALVETLVPGGSFTTETVSAVSDALGITSIVGGTCGLIGDAFDCLFGDD